jgi:hypothetical protein
MKGEFDNSITGPLPPCPEVEGSEDEDDGFLTSRKASLYFLNNKVRLRVAISTKNLQISTVPDRLRHLTVNP